MSFNFLDILVLLGSLQGFIISGLLFFPKKNQPSGRLLAVLILLISVACLNLFLINQSWFQSNSILLLVHALVPMVIVMPVGPLIFFYVKSRLDPHFLLNKKHRKYFYPVVIDLVPQITAIVYFLGLALGFFKPNNQPWGNFIDTYNVYADIPRWVSLAIYLVLSVKYIRSQKIIAKARGNGQSDQYKWPRQFVTVFMIFLLIWLVHLVPYIIPRFSDRLLDLVSWYPIYIPLAVMVYWLSVKGYYLQADRSPAFLQKERAPLPAETISQAIPLLKYAMENERLYLNPGLNLNMLAEQTGLPPKTISAVLNQHLCKSFSEFVNEYRIREIKEKILQPINSNLTIAGIAYDCGFNSQPTFHRAFKSITGITPKEFLQKNSQIQQ